MQTFKKIISLLSFFLVFGISTSQAQLVGVSVIGDLNFYHKTVKPYQEGSFSSPQNRTVQYPFNVMPGGGLGLWISGGGVQFSCEATVDYSPYSFHKSNPNGRGAFAIPVLGRFEFGLGGGVMPIGLAGGIQFNKTAFNLHPETGLQTTNQPFFLTGFGELSVGIQPLALGGIDENTPEKDVYIYHQIDLFARVGGAANGAFTAKVGVRYKFMVEVFDGYE